jgi:hypothetical protein
MDDKCYEVLSDMNQSNHIPIRLADFEKGDDKLLEAKSNRPVGEYCWTCSSSFIRYILREFKHDTCTYIDADMYFYQDPQSLVDEMLLAGKSVMVMPHRFSKGNEKQAEKVGTYCVEFNTFCNNQEGLEVLEYWRERCLDCCSNIGDGIHWGDQKYLEELVRNYKCVHVCHNLKAGVAPWNIDQYKIKDMPFIFYHFQSLRYISRLLIDINISTYPSIDLKLIDALYYPYLNKIEQKKKYLEQKGLTSQLIKKHPTDRSVSVWKQLFCFINPRRILSNIKLRYLHVHPYIINLGDEN